MMKHITRSNGRRRGFGKLLAMLLFSSFLIHHSSLPAFAQGNVGIGTTTPDASALLDLTSISRGLLVPRMKFAQMNSISSPANGLMVFVTDTASSGAYSGQTPTFWYYNSSFWVPFLGGGWLLLGNSGTNPSNNFIGTLDSEDWVIRTDNLERLRVYAGGNVGLTNTNNTAEELRFYEPSSSGSNYSGFKAGAQISSVTYTLPLADGNASNYVLCTDGFSNLSWRGFGTSGGGGNDTLWQRGTGKFALVGVGNGNIASGAYSIAAGQFCTASGANTTVFGYENLASGTAATVSGGEQDTASGNYADVGGGEYNTASGNYSTIGGGETNKACGTYSAIVGGNNNTACGNYSTVLGGSGNDVTGNYSMAFGENATVSQDSSVVFYVAGQTMKVGIGNASPTEVVDITGNLKFSGALMPNNLPGTSGYVLASTGASTSPVWTAPSNLYWTILGNTGTSPTTNYLGTTDAQPIVFRTNATERMRILSTGNVCIGVTSSSNQLHSLYAGTTDETAAIFGNATGATTNQAIGVWGYASNTSSTNTGTIGVLATGNGNTTAGQTNVALQLNDGEFTMGRTTEAPSVGTTVEAAASGTVYSQQGPSGVIELTMGGGNLTTAPPTAGVFQELGIDTIKNQFASASSIILVSVEQKISDGSTPSPQLAEYFVDADSRTAGSFTINIGMIPTTTSISNYTTTDELKIGYTIINPGR